MRDRHHAQSRGLWISSGQQGFRCEGSNLAGLLLKQVVGMEQCIRRSTAGLSVHGRARVSQWANDSWQGGGLEAGPLATS